MATGLTPVSNFLVPATGSTNGYFMRQIFPGSSPGFFLDFTTIALDGTPFRPSGVIIDNTKGTNLLTIIINETGMTINCPAGKSMTMPYPAPFNHTVTILGDGANDVVVAFVDYPVMPYGPI